MSQMAWNSKRLSFDWCVLPFILSNNPLRLCTISIQIPEIIWADLSIIYIYWSLIVYINKGLKEKHAKFKCHESRFNQSAQPTMLLQEIWSESVATLKSQYDGLKGDSDGVERQRIAFIQQWMSSPFLESVGFHIRWNYRIPTGICT